MSSVVRCACLMMQKDEATLLLPWVLYHGHLFGFDSLFVFDNGSTEPGVIAALDTVAGLGVHVDCSFNQKIDFVRKGEVLGARMRALQAAGGWDVFLPLDCDEFLALRDGDGVSFDRAQILAGLAALRDEERVPYVITAFTNVLGTIDRFRPESCLKTFVQARGFVELDHGFHQVRSTLSETPVDSGFVYIHCHAKPFERVVRDAREKLTFWCDVDSPAAADALEAENGPGWHLVRYLRMTEREYLSTFDHEGTVVLPGFAARLAEVGADTGFLLGGGDARRSGHGVMVFGAQGPAMNQLMRALDAAGLGIGDEAALYLNQHWVAAFKSGDGETVRRMLLVLAAQPKPWASWFPQAELLTAGMVEALRWPRAIQLVMPDDQPDPEEAVLRGLDLPVLQLRWDEAAAAPVAAAQAIAAFLTIEPTAERVAAMAGSLGGVGFEGWIDGASHSEVWGWCRLRGSDVRPSVDLFVDGVKRGTAIADEFRGDLLVAGVGDGRYGFKISLGDTPTGEDAIIDAGVAGLKMKLAQSGSRLADLLPR